MARCNSKTNLEVHHKRRDGGNDLDNAEVLCHDCHVNTDTYGKEGDSPKSFTQKIKEEALERAENMCECKRTGCGWH